MSDGFGAQIAISHDLCFKHQLRRLGGFGRDHIFRKSIPMIGRAASPRPTST